MAERVCQHCGRVYRGLVCHACHPRQSNPDPRASPRNKMRPSPSSVNALYQEIERSPDPVHIQEVSNACG